MDDRHKVNFDLFLLCCYFFFGSRTKNERMKRNFIIKYDPAHSAAAAAACTAAGIKWAVKQGKEQNTIDSPWLRHRHANGKHTQALKLRSFFFLLLRFFILF
jgi:hypothetical protein